MLHGTHLRLVPPKAPLRQPMAPIRTTLYELTRVLQEEFGREEDALVVAVIVWLVQEGWLTLLNENDTVLITL